MLLRLLLLPFLRGGRDGYGGSRHNIPFPGGMAELSFTAHAERPPSFLLILLSSLAFPLGKDAHVGRSAAVERGPSQGARSGSTGPMWASFPLHPC